MKGFWWMMCVHFKLVGLSIFHGKKLEKGHGSLETRCFFNCLASILPVRYTFSTKSVSVYLGNIDCRSAVRTSGNWYSTLQSIIKFNFKANNSQCNNNFLRTSQTFLAKQITRLFFRTMHSRFRSTHESTN